MARASVRDVPSAVLRIASIAEKSWRDEPRRMEFLRDLASEFAVAARRIPEATLSLRDVLFERVSRATRRAYHTERPWVQPNPHDPEGLAPTVLHVPPAEIDEFVDIVVGRYVRTLRTHWRKAAVDLWRDPCLDTVDDGAFGRLFRNTLFCRFLTDQLSDRDQHDISGTAVRAPQSRFVKIDLSELGRLDAFPGIYVAPTETLLEETPGTATLVPRVIRINGLTLRPEDRDAWDLGKYFVLQGASLSTLMGIHPTVHFPMDSINALTKSLLPPNHPVRCALEPHFYLQLPLNYAVMHIKRSFAHNDQREIYTSLPGSLQGFFRLARAYHLGVPGKNAYSAYQFPLAAPPMRYRYGPYLARWFEHILSFTTDVAARVRPGDPAVLIWAQHLSAHVPGFPGADDIFAGDTLARVMASFILDVAVVHSADHHSYANISIRTIPLRLRLPPPLSAQATRLDRTKLVLVEDLFRQFMSHEMYFKATTVRRLDAVRYDFFGDTRLRRAAQGFLAGFGQVDAAVAGSGYASLEELACSIQY